MKNVEKEQPKKSEENLPLDNNTNDEKVSNEGFFIEVSPEEQCIDQKEVGNGFIGAAGQDKEKLQRGLDLLFKTEKRGRIV